MDSDKPFLTNLNKIDNFVPSGWLYKIHLNLTGFLVCNYYFRRFLSLLTNVLHRITLMEAFLLFSFFNVRISVRFMRL